MTLNEAEATQLMEKYEKLLEKYHRLEKQYNDLVDVLGSAERLYTAACTTPVKQDIPERAVLLARVNDFEAACKAFGKRWMKEEEKQAEPFQKADGRVIDA